MTVRNQVRLVSLSVAFVAVVAGCALPVASVPIQGTVLAHVLTTEPDGTTVRVDELQMDLDHVRTGSATAGVAINPQLRDEVLTDRALGSDQVATAVIDASDYQTVGITWPEDETGERLEAAVRTRTDGDWSEWTDLEPSDMAPDAGTADATNEMTARGGTDPVWVGDVDAVQFAVDRSTAVTLGDLRVSVVGSDTPEPQMAGLVDEVTDLVNGMGPELLPTSTAPSVVTRGEWGAAAPSCAMGAAPLVGAVLHHTAGPNTYSTSAQAREQIRNDQRYHMQSRGWCDLGYNFVVDKWGTIYEGRSGSLNSSVIGVHAGGFNTGTVGISMLGTYESSPSHAVVDSVARIIGWKLQPYGVDPSGSMSYYTGEGENSRYKNRWVNLPRVMGHRDVAYTACPGTGGYSVLSEIRALARGYASPLIAAPTLSPRSIAVGGTVSVSASTISNVNWTMTVTDERTGAALYSTSGSATESGGGVATSWNGRTAGGATVGAGPYRVSISGTDSGTGAATNLASAIVEVTGSTNPPTVAPVPLVGDLQFVPVTPVRVVDTRWTGQSLGPSSRLDAVVAGVGGIPADAKAVALNVTAVSPTAVTYMTAWPAGAAQPGASILNATPGITSAAATILGVGGEGKISIYNNRGSLHTIVDVTGYYVTTGGTNYEPLASPGRIYDSRAQGGQAPGTTRTVQVAGAGGIPADATAVVLNVVSVGSQSAGYVSVVPEGADPRAISTVNHRVGEDVANRATVALGDGKISVYLEGGAAGIVVDVVGWYGSSGTLQLTPISPVRVVDTRSGAPLSQGETRTFSVRGALDDLSDADVAVMTVTATQQSAFATYLTFGAAGSSLGATSDLNTGAGRDQATLALVPWDSSGRVAAYNNRGLTHLVMDVTAVFS